MISKFFLNMASRLRNENDLSDITWAMCETSERFKWFFLHFFFPEVFKEGVSCGDVIIEREKSFPIGRPDFWFEYNGEPYIIENKIYDENHHFEQYTCIGDELTEDEREKGKVCKGNLGYIVNYDYSYLDYDIKTWNSLLTELLKFVKGDEDMLIKAYCDYLKQVCSIYIIDKPMNVDAIKTINALMKTLKGIFGAFETGEDFKVTDDKIWNDELEYCIGRSFHLDFKNAEKMNSWGVFVMKEDQDTKKATFKIGFKSDTPVYEQIKATGSWWWKSMSPEDLSSFSSCIDAEKQKEILKSFFKKTITEIVQNLDNN